MKTLNVYTFAFLFLFPLSLMAADATPKDGEQLEAARFHELCVYNQRLVEEFYPEEEQYKVECRANYHHYNSDAWKKNYKKTSVNDSGNIVRISNFNVWHPGKSNTRSKDYEIVAQIINKFDIVAGLELLPSVGEEGSINEKVVAELKDIIPVRNRIRGIYRRATREETIAKYKKKLDELNATIEKFSAAFNQPGYMKILEALKKIDPSWALLLQPKGEAAKATDVQELVGYFYRSTMVKPVVQRYCRDMIIKNGGAGANPYGCIPQFSTLDLGRNLRHVFSRRPFIANFESGNFDYTMVASHVVFNSPSNSAQKEAILKSAYGEEYLKSLGIEKIDSKALKKLGVTSATYARAAEVKVMTEFMTYLKDNYGEKDIILAGDFNLEKESKLWAHILNEENALELLVDEKTSVTEKRYSEGLESMGYASNYDHFILEPNHSHECDTGSAKLFDFIREPSILESISERYLVRSDEVIANVLYQPIAGAEDKIEVAVAKLREKLTNDKRILRGEVIARYKPEEIELRIAEFKRRIFGYQLSDLTYYRVFKEIVSDHAPVAMNCSTSKKDDDSRVGPENTNVEAEVNQQ